MQWCKIGNSKRHAEFCDAHGYRCFVEASRWSPHPLAQHRDEWEGYVNAIRVGAWTDLDTAKNLTIAAAQMRSEREKTATQP